MRALDVIKTQKLKSFPQPIGRYGNPDMLFLGTLKIKFQIWKVFNLLMLNLMKILKFQGCQLNFTLKNLKYGNPEAENTKIFLKFLIRSEFLENFANKACRNESHFPVYESTKKCYFQGAGAIFLNFIFLASFKSISQYATVSFDGHNFYTCKHPRTYVLRGTKKT